MALRTGRGKRVRVAMAGMKSAASGADDGHEHVHVHGEVQEAVVEAERDAVRRRGWRWRCSGGTRGCRR